MCSTFVRRATVAFSTSPLSEAEDEQGTDALADQLKADGV